jgi:hypothetical protein
MKTAIQLELARVRNLKRSLEAEVELLRSDAERGKLHIRVNQSKEFRQELAKAIVDSAMFGYSYYADVVDGVIYKRKGSTAWSLWPESVSWRIVPIESLFPANYDFSAEIEDWSSSDTWEGCEIGFGTIVEAYLVEKGDELEENGDIPEWTIPLKRDIISFAFDSEFGHYLAAIEEASKQRAIEFALELINDNLVFEIGNN